MTKVKTALLALIAAALLVVGVAHRHDIKWQNPDEIRAQENQSALSENETYPGFPQGHEGVWTYEDTKGNRQTLIMRGHQLIISNPQQGTLYYDGIETQGTPDPEQNPEQPITLLWDIDRFVERYGAELLGPGPQPFIYHYDQQSDQLALSEQIVFERDEVAELVWTIKNQLAASQPINLEQLSHVDDDFLLEEWQLVQDNQLELAALEQLYQRIAFEYTELSLLVAEDYARYYEIAENITAYSEYSFSDLNTALPADIFNLYQKAKTTLNSEDPATIVAAILPKITTAREDYLSRRTEYENSLHQTN